MDMYQKKHQTKQSRHQSLLVILPLLILLITLIAPQASAIVMYTDFYLTIKDLATDKNIPSLPVNMEITNVNTGTTINLSKRIDRDAILNHRLNVGTWKIKITADDFTTPEMDFIGERTFIVEENTPSSNEMMYLSQIGAVEITVLDIGDSTAEGAEVTIKCKSFKDEGITDRFGTFRFNNVPVGSCNAQAAFKNSIGSIQIIVPKGGLASTNVVLDQTTITTQNIMYIIIGTVIIIAFLVIIQVIRKKYAKNLEKEKKKTKTAVKKGEEATIAEAKKQSRKKNEKYKDKTVKSLPQEKAKEEAKNPEVSKEESSSTEKKNINKEEPVKEELNPRARDIMATLNERETKIVNFLLENNNKGTQATLRSGTGIPKTSLARVFQSLENKKVITVEKIGKLKKVDLTDWFLGKE